MGAVEDLAELIVGEDPTRIEHLWQMMFRQHFWHGNGIVRGTAMSGIDIALWDILGKVHGVPCHKLWGGPVRDYVRLYGHLGGGKMEDFYESDEPQRFGELAAGMVEQGFTAFKSMAVPPTMPLEGLAPVRHAERCVAAMRDAVGDEIDIMVDCHARPSPRMGHLFAAALEQFGLYWFEEPCWPERVDDIAAIQRVGARRRSRPASGSSAAQAFDELLDEGRLQCDPARHHALRRPHARCAGSRRSPRSTASRSRRTTRRGPCRTAASIELGLATPVVHHLRGGHVRRALARRGRDRVAPDRPRRDARPGDRPARPRDRDRPRRRRAAPVRAGAAAARLLRRRQRRRLVEVGSVGAEFRFSGRVALVTGGASGIGAAVAKRMLAEGARVASLDLSAEAPEGALAVAADVSDSAEVRAATERVAAELGPIDVLVCSAGVTGQSLPTVEVTDEEWRRVLVINADGVFFCNRAVIPGMVERGYGRIVNVASIAGKEGNPMAAAYSASKAAVIALTKAIGKDLARTGVIVNCIAPAVIETPILTGISQEHIDYMVERIPMGRVGRPVEVAALVCWLASEECSFSTGATYDISGGRAVY